MIQIVDDESSETTHSLASIDPISQANPNEGGERKYQGTVSAQSNKLNTTRLIQQTNKSEVGVDKTSEFPENNVGGGT